jgi:hypothetical protein
MFRRLSQLIKLNGDRENYKTIKQSKALMAEEYYLVYSRRKSGMHP